MHDHFDGVAAREYILRKLPKIILELASILLASVRARVSDGGNMTENAPIEMQPARYSYLSVSDMAASSAT
jgi:hypothetical protein